MFDREGTQGFVAKSSTFAVVAFRGTQPDEYVDSLRNVAFLWEHFQGEAQVHRGFLRALDAVWCDVDSALDETGELPSWYTGHSLGAALATLAAARRRPHALATFGSPLVGNPAFRELLSGLPILRFANCADIVTTVPPATFGYCHVGTHVFLDESHLPVIDPSTSLVRRRRVGAIIRYALRLPWLRPGQVKPRSFVDHAIVNYSACICQNMADHEKLHTPHRESGSIRKDEEVK